MRRRWLLADALAVGFVSACQRLGITRGSTTADTRNDEPAVAAEDRPPSGGQIGDDMKVVKTDAEWRELLTLEQYEVTRRKGTEQPFSGQYYASKEEGTYVCVGCGSELFGSDAKYESGTGWPSFWAPIREGAVAEEVDVSFGMRRVEALCSWCDAHLGRVFTDGPKPTGLRYCMNSVALRLVKAE